MRKRIGNTILICLLAAVMSACQVQNVTAGMGEGERYDAVVAVRSGSVLETGEPQEAEQGALLLLKEEFDAVTALLGKTDTEAAKMLGGGSESRTEDGNILVGRSYQTALFGKECFVTTSYGSDGTVEMVFAAFSGAELAECVEQLSELLGTQGQMQGVEESADAGEALSWTWKVGSYAISMYEVEGVISLDIEEDT